MSTTLLNCEIELSKQLGDYWAGTTTSDGADGGTTLIDTALMAKQDAWITDESYDMLTEGTAKAAVGTITGISIAEPTVVTTSAVHGLTSDDIVTISGTNSTPVIDGIRTVTVVTPTTFTVPIEVTGTGTAGTITAGTLYEERKISSLSNTAGTLTVLAHGGGIGSGIDYRIHRLFSASDKRIALIAAARRVYPALSTRVWDESIVSGNWLKDGSFEIWTDSTDLTYWTETDLTATQTSTVGQFKHGSYGVALSTATGTLVQSISDFADLQFLRGRSVTFTLQAYCTKADALRISVDDGTTQTYSSYHAGDSAWTEDNPRNDNFYVTQYIAPNATEVTFTIHYGDTAATVYVDDARGIAGHRGRLYIGNLGLALDKPHKIEMEPTYYSQDEDWIRVRDYNVDSDGYLYLPTNYANDRRLRIRGIGYLDFLASGVSSTAWTATIAVDSPQLDILVAEAALYLYTTMAMPNAESGTREAYQEMIAFWAQQLATAKGKFGMKSPGATIHWSVH